MHVLLTLVDDVRFGVRALRKGAGVAAATILTFAVGIGLNAGVFTVINGLLFRPRVAHDPASFVDLQIERTDQSGRKTGPLASIEQYEAFARARSLRDVAAWTPVHASLGDQTGAGEYIPLLVSCNFFAAYGPEKPLRGRLLRAEDCRVPEAPAPVVIGEDLWRTSLAADPDVVGSTLLLNRRPFTVVGVMPSGYAGQLRGAIWVPLSMARMFFGGRDPYGERTIPWLMGIVGRLNAGFSRDSAAAELAVIAGRLDAAAPGQRTTVRAGTGAMIETPVVRDSASWSVPLVMAAPIIVLLIACANAALLLLSRAIARRREVAVRISLGASPRRVLQMLLVESALLAATGAPLSIALAYSAPRLLRWLVPSLPVYSFAIDATVVAYVIAVTMSAGVVAGIAPALEALRKNVNAGLHSHDGTPGLSGWRPRDVLVAAQVGLSLALLVATGLFLRAEMRLAAADPGYDADHVLAVLPRIAIPPYTIESATSFYTTLFERARRIPGVRALSYGRDGGDENARAKSNTITTIDTNVSAAAAVAVVSSAHFDTLRIPLAAGSSFSDAPSATPSVVISESLASALWPRRTALGNRARFGTTEVSIAGVARDLPSMLSGAGERTIYTTASAVRAGDVVYVGFAGAEAETARALRDAIVELDPNAAAQPTTVGAARREQARKFVPLVEMVMGLGLVGLALGVAGIYAVVAFAVSRRTREMGIRIALGATHRDIVVGVMRSNAAPIVAGIVGGLGLAAIGAHTIARVFATTPVRMDAWDPTVYTAVIAVLSVAAIAAMLGPAERAAATDPINALRQE